MRMSIATTIGFAAALALVTTSADAAQARKHRRHASGPTTVTPLQYGTNLFPPGPVYYGREYLGNDPDPRVRLQLQRDLGAHFGGAD